MLLTRLVGKALRRLEKETQRTELNSLPGFAETPWTTRCNLKSTATHSFTLCKTRISVLVRFSRDTFTVPLFHATSKRYCIWKRQYQNNSCAPKSVCRLCFSIPNGACCCRVVWALVGCSYGYCFSELEGRTASSRGVPLWISQSSSEQHSQTSITLTHPKRVLIRQDASDRMMACTMFGGPSAVPARSVVSANNLDQKVKWHRKFEQRHLSCRLCFYIPMGTCCCGVVGVLVGWSWLPFFEDQQLLLVWGV